VRILIYLLAVSRIRSSRPPLKYSSLLISSPTPELKVTLSPFGPFTLSKLILITFLPPLYSTDHFKSANISKFRATKWSEIYDFTPNDLSPNWSRYSPRKHQPERYICPPSQDSTSFDLKFSVSESLSFIPLTHHFDPEVTFPHSWRKEQVTFILEPGKDLSTLESEMTKFYEDSFVGTSVDQGGPILANIECMRTKFVFTFYNK